MKLARRTSPCVACGAPIVVDTPIAPLLGQNGRIRLCINRPFHLRREILIYAQAYGGCMPRARRRRHNRALIGSAAAYVTWAITALSRIRLWLTCLAVWKSKFYGAFASSSTPSTQPLLDGVAMPVPHPRRSQDGRVIAEK